MLGRVYIIQSPNTNMVYIGSTTMTLKDRFRKHKKLSNLTASKIIIDEGEATIDLLEEIKVIDERELEFYEQQYIELYRDIAVNGKNAFGQDKEKKQKRAEKYREKNKDYISETDKKYREKNKDKLHEKFDCPCGGKYIKSSKSRHIKTQKHRTFLENIAQE